MKRFPLLATVALAAFVSTSPAPLRAAERPNVILFLVDDMGWTDCGAYGSKYYETPHMDRFAQKAMRFTQAYAQPLCSPTRASLLTGQYSARHGITSATGHQPPQEAGHAMLPATAPATQPMLLPESRNYLEPAQQTLAETLRTAGWRTAHIGKWHLGLTQPHWPEQQGFDVTFHCHPDPGPPGNYFSPYGVIPDGKPNGKNRVGNITDGPPGEYIVDRLADEAIRFIRSSKETGKPFYLNLWNYGVHGPWGHKEEYTRQFMNKKDPRGAQGNPIMASMLKSVDECFGRVLAELEHQGMMENTIVIFNSDNGGNTHSNVPDTAKTAKAEKNKSDSLADWRKWAGNQPPTMNTPLRDGKGTLYEGGTRVPLMWAWAGHIRPGSESAAVVGHIDLYPTLLDLLALERPAGQKLDGVSYAPVLTSSGGLERKAFFNYFPHAGANRAGGVWVRAGDLKLIRWFGNPVTHELYDLAKDEGETQNLAATLPDKVKELDAMIDSFLQDTGATYPRPNPAFKGTPPAARPGRTARPLGGWVPKGCTVEELATGMVVTGTGPAPFLGLTGLKLPGPVKLTLQTRGAGGAGRVQWRTTAQETFPEQGQVVEFTLPAAPESAATTTVELPVQGDLLHLRLYLPAQRNPVTIEKAGLAPAHGEGVKWDFLRAKSR